MTTSFVSQFAPRDRAVIDGDESLIGTVTAFQFRPSSDRSGNNVMVEVSYVHNGEAKVAWVEEDRLTKK
jgi:hypothetical protein